MFIPALLFSVSYLSSAVANADRVLPKMHRPRDETEIDLDCTGVQSAERI